MGGQGGHAEAVSADAISLLQLGRVIFKATKGVQGRQPTG